MNLIKSSEQSMDPKYNAQRRGLLSTDPFDHPDRHKLRSHLLGTLLGFDAGTSLARA